MTIDDDETLKTFVNTVLESVKEQGKKMVQGVVVYILDKDGNKLGALKSKWTASSLFYRTARGKCNAVRVKEKHPSELLNPTNIVGVFKASYYICNTGFLNKPFPVQGAMIVNYKQEKIYIAVSGCARAKDDIIVLEKALNKAGCSKFENFECTLE